MYKTTIAGKTFHLDFKGNDIAAEGQKFEADITAISSRKLHILRNNKSYTAEIIEVNREEKTVTLKLNSRRYEVSVKDHYDELLEKLGMDKAHARTGGDVKAPMPGLVLKVLVNKGDKIIKGEPMLILQAMKMENIMKAPSEGIISNVYLKQGDTVEKNQVMVSIE